MATYDVIEVRAECRPFADHHALPVPEAGWELVIGAEFGGGGFGTIHPVERFGRATPPMPLAAKVFNPDALGGKDGLNATARRIEGFYGAAGASGGPGWPELVLALPYWVGWVECPGERLLVGLMIDLRARGYEKAPFSDLGDLFDYRRKRRADRLDLAASFAAKAAFFERIGFIHADINPENLLFDYGSADVQLIDLDGGCVAAGGETPFADGKRDDCMPPELKPGRSGVARKDRFDLSAERWSIGIVTGYLILGLPPTYFIKQITADSVEAYGRTYRWPDIDIGSPLFNPEPRNRAAYRKMLMQGEFSAIPDAIRESMADLFAAGADGDRRPTAARWSAVLEGNQVPPVISEFEVSDEFVLPGDEVTLAWSVEGADCTEITGLGHVASSGKVSIRIHRHQAFSIRSINHFGEAVATTVTVIPVDLPVVRQVNLPPPPGFELPPMPINHTALYPKGAWPADPTRPQNSERNS